MVTIEALTALHQRREAWICHPMVESNAQVCRVWRPRDIHKLISCNILGKSRADAAWKLQVCAPRPGFSTYRKKYSASERDNNWAGCTAPAIMTSACDADQTGSCSSSLPCGLSNNFRTQELLGCRRHVPISSPSELVLQVALTAGQLACVFLAAFPMSAKIKPDFIVSTAGLPTLHLKTANSSRTWVAALDLWADRHV